jgi:hypothetical protein
MYKTAIAIFAFVLFVCFGGGYNVYAQIANCPDISGTWNFSQTVIQICYTAAPKLTMPKGNKPSSYTPGIVQGQEFGGDFEESGQPTLIKKTGTYTIYQAVNDDNYPSCFIHAKRVHSHTKNSGYIENEYNIIPPREDWYTGVIHGNGTTITMRAIPSASSPAGRWEGSLIKEVGATTITKIGIIVDTDIPAPLCYPIANTGAQAGGGELTRPSLQ